MEWEDELKSGQKKSPLLVVIPAYNEEKNIEYVIDDIHPYRAEEAIRISYGKSDRSRVQLVKSTKMVSMEAMIGIKG